MFAAVPAVADDSDATATSFDIDTASDITDHSDTTKATWSVSSGVLNLTGNTIWNLKADVSVTTLKKIDLSGYTLTIQSANAKANYTLTLTSAATDVSFIINSGNTQSSVCLLYTSDAADEL